MIENSKGEQQNLEKLSYNTDYTQNRAMLSKVATYYAKQVGLDLEIGVKDYNQDYEGAMAVTGLESCSVSMVIVNGKISADANTSNNIMNSLVHEKYHVETATIGAMAEMSAITMQMSHSSWFRTTETFQKGIVGYLSFNAMEYIKSIEGKTGYPSVQTFINPIMPILNRSYHTLLYNGGEYLPIDNDIYNH